MNTNPGEGSNTLHVERPKFNERRRFSSYGEYKKIRNQGPASQETEFCDRRAEMLGVDESGGDVSGIGDCREDDDEVG